MLNPRVAAVRFVLLLAVAGVAYAQVGAASSSYVRENWTVADGLPINTITAVFAPAKDALDEEPDSSL